MVSDRGVGGSLQRDASLIELGKWILIFLPKGATSRTENPE